MKSGDQLVYVVDDDAGVLDSLKLLLESCGIETQVFQDAESFLHSFSPEIGGCLLLDLKMPGKSGLELQAELSAVEAILPIIFLTATDDVPSAVKALKAGAFDFLQKPFGTDELLATVRKALKADSKRREEFQRQQSVKKRLDKLTRREAEVLSYIIEGHPNKVIAIELSLSQRTIEIYRSNVMHKMQAQSLAQLVKLVAENPAIANKS